MSFYYSVFHKYRIFYPLIFRTMNGPYFSSPFDQPHLCQYISSIYDIQFYVQFMYMVIFHVHFTSYMVCHFLFFFKELKFWKKKTNAMGGALALCGDCRQIPQTKKQKHEPRHRHPTDRYNRKNTGVKKYIMRNFKNPASIITLTVTVRLKEATVFFSAT